MAYESRRLQPGCFMKVEERTFELSELCRIFLGRWMKFFFTLAAAGDLYGLTWALAVVFGSTFADKFSLETSWDYELFVLIFMAICVPISCLPIVGQVSLQLCFLAGRTIMVLLSICRSNLILGDKLDLLQETLPVQTLPISSHSFRSWYFLPPFSFRYPGLQRRPEIKQRWFPLLARLWLIFLPPILS
jgi:amino acid permease